VAFSPDGLSVLTGSDDKTARLWNVTTGLPLGNPLPHPYPVETVAFARDGRKAYTGDRTEREVRCWDTSTGEARGGLTGHQDGIRVLALAPASSVVLSGSYDRTARFWNTETGKQVGLPLQHQDTVRDVAFGPDGRTALTGSFDTTARRWHAPTGIPIGPPFLHRGKIRAVALSTDGKTAATASWDGTVLLWESPPALAGTPKQLAHWAQAITGVDLDDGGGTRTLDGAAWQEARRLAKLAGPE
jgi:WD40 repeat protein